MQFEFATATTIIFGPGKIRDIEQITKKFDNRLLVVCGSDLQRIELLLDRLNSQQIKYETFQVSEEPTTTAAIQAVQIARQQKYEGVIAIGGGSVLDIGKVIAAMITNPGELMDYLEVIGAGKELSQRSAPFIAIPTTSGTGAEVTRNAVLKSTEHFLKVSMRSPFMLPEIALVDPELTYSMPPSVTASTGLDALTQLMEAFMTKKANPLTDGICREGIRLAGHSLKQVFENGNDKQARLNMSMASLFSGLALANAGLGAVHGFAGPIGGMFPAPHGVVCARLLPFVMEANIRALNERWSHSPLLKRFDEMAKILTGNSDAKAEQGLKWILSLCETLKVPSLSTYGLKEQGIAEVVARSKKASSMKGNPIELTNEELVEILRNAL